MSGEHVRNAIEDRIRQVSKNLADDEWKLHLAEGQVYTFMERVAQFQAELDELRGALDALSVAEEATE